jgi:hypothetical protein
MASAPPQPRSVEELHRTHLKRTADFFSGDVGGRAELDEARRVRARRRTAQQLALQTAVSSAACRPSGWPCMSCLP